MLKNVLDTTLELVDDALHTKVCRIGCCNSTHANHSPIVCVQVTEEFLEFSTRVGSDLTTPIPEWDFHGLKPGDQWNLCLQVWIQAWQNDAAPNVYLKYTPKEILNHIDFTTLSQYAIESE